MTTPTSPMQAAPRRPGPAEHVARRARGLAGSALADLLTLADGRDVIDLAVGTPRFPATPPELVDAAVLALRAGRNQYAPPMGDALLREAIAASLRTPADPETEITITAGGTEGLCVALQSLVDPGDEVVVLEPFYENFLSAIALAGGVPRVVPLEPPAWNCDPERLRAAFGPRTRAIVLNTPSNPTGRALSRDDLAVVAGLCEEWDVVAISDEVYASLVFDGADHLSVADVPALKARSVVVGSLSKSHAISGWRIGYLRAPAQRTQILRRVHEVTTSGTAAPLQAALTHTALDDGAARVRADELGRLRDRTVSLFTRLGMRFGPIQGGCFALGRIDGFTDEDGVSFTARLLRERSVLVAPGKPFFLDARHSGPYVRIAFNRPWEVLATLEDRLFGPPTPLQDRRDTRSAP